MICKSQNKQNLKRRRNALEKEMEIQITILMIPKPLMMINKKIQMTIIIRVNQELREAGFKTNQLEQVLAEQGKILIQMSNHMHNMNLKALNIQMLVFTVEEMRHLQRNHV